MKKRVVFVLFFLSIFLISGCSYSTFYQTKGKVFQEKCVFEAGSGLFCDDYSANSEGITISIKNVLSESITINSMSIYLRDENIKTCNFKGPKVISSDDFGTVIASCSLNPGDRVEGKISVIYTPNDKTTPKIANGDISTIFV